jgi:hypothetical protein
MARSFHHPAPSKAFPLMMMSLRKNDVGGKSNKKPNTILFQIEKQ